MTDGWERTVSGVSRRWPLSAVSEAAAIQTAPVPAQSDAGERTTRGAAGHRGHPGALRSPCSRGVNGARRSLAAQEATFLARRRRCISERRGGDLRYTVAPFYRPAAIGLIGSGH